MSLYHRESGALSAELASMDSCMPVYYKLTGGHGSGAEYMMRAEAEFMRGTVEEAETYAYRAMFEAKGKKQSSIYQCGLFLLAEIAAFIGDRDMLSEEIFEMSESAAGNNEDLCRYSLDLFLGYICAVTGLAKGDFNWRLLRYVYTNNPGKNKNIVTQEFPVITYITSQNVTQPGGVIPTSVKVTPSAQSVDETGPIKYKNTKNFTVEAAGVSRETRVELDGAPLGMTLEPVSIGSSRAITFGVSIDGNVEAGSYDLKLKVGGVESNTFTLNVNEYSALIYLGADKKSIDFGSIRYDYSGTKPTCDTQYVTIENISTTQVENLTAELGDGSPFEISEDLSRTTLYANGLANSTATVGIRPKKGLAVGVHNGALTVTNRETSIATTLKVTITEPTLPGEVTFDHMLSVASNPVTVYVTPPKDDGGAKMTDYLYTVRNHPDYLDSDGRQVWKSSGISVQSASYFGLTLRDDLETGKTYEIGVKAVNECGEGALALVSVEVDASIPPSEVRNVRVYPGDGCAAVTWDEPDYFGKNLLQPEVTFLNYSVHTYKGYEFVSAEGATGTQYFKSGLENGAEYTFMIQAINMVDTSSFYTDAIVPQSKNSAPVCPNEFKVKTSYKLSGAELERADL